MGDFALPGLRIRTAAPRRGGDLGRGRRPVRDPLHRPHPARLTCELRIPQSGIHVAYDAAAAVAIVVALGVPLDPRRRGRWRRSDRPSGASSGSRPAIARSSWPSPRTRPPTTRPCARSPPRVSRDQLLIGGQQHARRRRGLRAGCGTWTSRGPAETVERVIVSGTRAPTSSPTDSSTRAFDPARMTVDRGSTAAGRSNAALEAVGPGGRLTILAGYTPTIELREEMRRRGWRLGWADTGQRADRPSASD